MERRVDLAEISDGKQYGINDMARAGCGGCEGCSVCCRGMGRTVVLDPYDVYRMTEGLSVSFERLLQEKKLELNVVDGLILPNLAMNGPQEACAFLNEEGRCRIHPWRPGICRLFPMGRLYGEDGGFTYFLQIHECRKKERTKIRVRRLLDTPDTGRYEAYIARWHDFRKSLQKQLAGDAAREREVNLALLKLFFLTPYAPGEDFYPQFDARMKRMEEKTGC